MSVFLINMSVWKKINIHDPNLIENPIKLMVLHWKNIHKIIATVLLIVSFISINPTMAEEAKIEKINNAVKLNLKNEKPAVLEKSKPVIVPGESTIQRQAREQAEAEVKAKAEADRLRIEAESAPKRNTISREKRVYNDPSNFDAIYMRAEDRYGVDWRILKAVHYIETGGSGSTSRSSYAGAQGPMQFLPSTWRRYGVDGNGDGVADITNVEDAIYSAAAYLQVCGNPDVKKALWGYNPSSAYFRKVMDVAASLGY